MDKLKNETLKFLWKDDSKLVERELVRYKKVASYITSGGKLLDVGCRGGELRKYVNEKLEYYGTDFIEHYKEFVPNFIHHDITSSNFPKQDNCFDYIYLGEILEHISNFFFVFEEMYRILKPNGLLIITVPNNFNAYQALGVVKYKKYKKKCLDIKRVINADTHIHSFYEPDFLKICQMLGFKPVDADRFSNSYKKIKLPEIPLFKPFAKFILYVARK